MAQKTNSSEGRGEPAQDTKPPEIIDLIAKVAQLLQDGRPDKAIDVIARAKINSPWVKNLLGVCQLRLGNAKETVDVFRGLVLAAGGLVLRKDVPTVFKTNYATALFAADNMSGGVGVLQEIAHENHPAVQRLQAAIQNWKNSLTLWEKLNWYLGGQPNRPLVLDFPLGDLE